MYMKIYNDCNFQIKEPTAVTLGNFDGVHLGHQKLIETVKEYAKRDKLKSVVFSFFPHPMAFFGKTTNFNTMFSVEEKTFVLDKADVDILIQYPFTKEFAELSPEEFFDILIEKTNCRVLVVGENYCFGKDRVGTYSTLKEIGEKKGVLVIAIPSVKVDGVRVSSTRIRGLIEKGDMEQIRVLLDKPYFVLGEVQSGDKRGRKMQIPTINLLPQDSKLLPPDGVYATRVAVDGEIYHSITNIGDNPTFKGTKRTIETFIFDFNECLYGENVQICFYKMIRPERTFDNINELKKQITYDKAIAIHCLEKIDRAEYKFR